MKNIASLRMLLLPMLLFFIIGSGRSQETYTRSITTAACEIVLANSMVAMIRFFMALGLSDYN